MSETEIIFGHISLTNWLTILAILIAPWAALFIQERLAKNKEVRKSKLVIFKTLMATRHSPLSLEHIQALNMIDIEFYGNKKYKDVRRAWRNYLDVRSNSQKTEIQQELFNRECENTLTTLLVSMGEVLGYEFDESHMRQSVYKPQGHVTEEQYQMLMRENLVKLFAGELALPMSITSLPIKESDIQEQKKLRELAMKYLEKQLIEGDSAKIKQEPI